MSKISFPRTSLVCLSIVLLSSCTYLPRSGPDAKLIDTQASIKVSSPDRRVGIDYALIDLNQNTLKFFDQKSIASLKESFGGGRGGARTFRSAMVMLSRFRFLNPSREACSSLQTRVAARAIS